MKKKSIIFDLDGTLVDSAPGILKCFRHVLEANSLVAEVDLSQQLIGPPLSETLTRLTGISASAELEKLIDDFRGCYDGGGMFETPFYDGIEALLKQLDTMAVDMHVATNKRLFPSRAILEHLGCLNQFSSVYALDMKSPGFTNKAEMLARQLIDVQLNPSSVIYVGDKKEDGEAADANGLSFAYASWGYGDLEQDDISSRWIWLDSPADLADLLCL